MHDYAGRYTRSPDSSTVSPESLLTLLNNPAEPSVSRIEDVTAEIQTGEKCGAVQGSVVLDEPLAKLAEKTRNLKRTLAIAEQTRQKYRDASGGIRLTPLSYLDADVVQQMMPQLEWGARKADGRPLGNLHGHGKGNRF